ncbi:hypothetical protein [Actinophytocola oryzae]|uniref:hypothetical protein n=1 Tax=Actinophytocola oryzae TaxID=502181 RepID=UPI0010632E1B|nr:hypothetical protein [Actinophytocola oryzae]
MPGVCLGMALLVLGPLLGRGFVLTYDMVFTPRQFLLADAFGLGSALPRSVPADAVMAAVTSLVPGDLVQQVLLFGALFAGPLGAARLVPSEAIGVRVVAAVSYGWTAYLAERLVMGHWPYLLAYAALPWVVTASRSGTARLVLACVPGILTPTGGILVAGAAIVGGGTRRLRVTVPVALVLNAPWLVAALSHTANSLSTEDGVAAFAARGETWGGPVLSVLGLGGIWNAEVVPGSRGNPVLPVVTVLTVAVALLGLREIRERWARRITLLGAFGVLLAALPTVPGGGELLGWTVANVPGGGLLRDSQKWVAWWALPAALGVAMAVGRLNRKAVLAAAVAVPVLLLPDFAFGAWGRLHPVEYPADWAAVRDILARDDRVGDVVTMPFGAFRQFGWNADRTQLDPAPRFLPRSTVVDDTLYVNGRALAGEDPRAAAVRRGEPLGRLGIGWVLVERGTPSHVDTAGLEPVYRGRWLDLYRVGGPVGDPPDGPPVAPVLVAFVAAGSLILFSLLWLALPTGRLTALHRRGQE